MTELAKGEKSFYHLYLATLPEKVDGLPSDFTKDELALLEGSPLLANIRKKIENIRHDFELQGARSAGIGSIHIRRV